uniref:Protein krueppel n=1 Tax=Anopheles christyi TaxID=43041 RepID=A0A182KHI1_9DIPT
MNDLVHLRLNFENVCRFCLSQKDCVPLFIKSTINKILIDAVDVLLLKIDEHDGLPNCVCAQCHQRMADYAEFETAAREAYNTLQSVLTHLDNGDAYHEDQKVTKEIEDFNFDLLPILGDSDECLEKKADSVENDDDQEAASITLEIETPATETRPASKPREKKACPVCGKLVSQISKHMPVHSKKTKTFSCEHCDKCFAQQDGLRKHLKIHRNIRNYRCEHCEARFCDRSSLRYHLAKHRGVPGFQCELCDRRFYTSSQWKQHHALAHRQRMFRCDICGQMFLLKHHLTEHAQLHTDGRPHECDVCGKAFKRERYFNSEAADLYAMSLEHLFSDLAKCKRDKLSVS